MKRQFKTLIILLLSLLFLIPAGAYGDISSGMTLRTAKQANIRKKPTKSSELVERMDPHKEVLVLDVVQTGSETWVHVQIQKSKRKGYILSTLLEDTSKPKETSAEVKTGNPVYNATLSENAQIAEIRDPQQTGNTENGAYLNGGETVEYNGYGYYVGSFNNGKRYGEGSFLWNNGDRYAGEWNNDSISGMGTLIFKDGIICEGTFKNGKLQEGTITYPQSDNRKLVRTVTKGKFKSESILYWPDGTSLKGKIETGKKNFSGKVTIAYACGDTYVGTLKNGLKSGTGTYSWNDGAHYEGAWAKDMMHGTGKYYFNSSPDSDYITGTFKENLPSKSITLMHNGKKFRSVWDTDMCTDIYEK